MVTADLGRVLPCSERGAVNEVMQPSAQGSEGREPRCRRSVPWETPGAQRGGVPARPQAASPSTLGGPVLCQGPGDHRPVRHLHLTPENSPLLAAPGKPGEGVGWTRGCSPTLQMGHGAPQGKASGPQPHRV